ncbi:hypothetical protein DV736_g4663, partial [Chaetothyriales sp. CBS 134916]
MSSLSSYIAQKYLSASTPSSHLRDSDRPKKRRKKEKKDREGRGRSSQDGNADADGPQMDTSANSRSAEFRRTKKSGWMDISTTTGATSTDSHADGGDEEADRMLRETMAQDSQRRREMASGVRAGLQTAADTAKRIDVNAKRIEARQREREVEELKKRQREDAMGDVQRREKQERKQDLEDAKFLTLARTADDEEMNERLKSQVRWGDVMAGYMAEKQVREDDGGSLRTAPAAELGKSGDGRERGQKSRLATGSVYQGHAPPNRYGIKPGWRWDGVDRGNGFEKQWFQARAQKARNTDLTYQWQEDE